MKHQNASNKATSMPDFRPPDAKIRTISTSILNFAHSCAPYRPVVHPSKVADSAIGHDSRALVLPLDVTRRRHIRCRLI